MESKVTLTVSTYRPPLRSQQDHQVFVCMFWLEVTIESGKGQVKGKSQVEKVQGRFTSIDAAERFCARVVYRLQQKVANLDMMEALRQFGNFVKAIAEEANSEVTTTA